MARRSASRSTSADTVVAGVVTGAHGLRGEISVAPETDNRERFRAGRRILLDGVPREILRVRGSATDLILRLEGVADRGAARALAGKELRVPLAEARSEARGYLWRDLVGLCVLDESGRELGALAEVLRTGGGADVFVVRSADGGELLLPAIDSVVLSVELERGRIVVRPQEQA